MKSRSNLILTGGVLALLLSLAACGKKKEDDAATGDGPQSSQGALLESVQKTVDQANERTKKAKEDVENSAE